MLHTTYIAHNHINSSHPNAIRTMVMAMECSTVAGGGNTVSRNKGSTELAAIALAWFTLDDFFLML